VFSTLFDLETPTDAKFVCTVFCFRWFRFSFEAGYGTFTTVYYWFLIQGKFSDFSIWTCACDPISINTQRGAKWIHLLWHNTKTCSNNTENFKFSVSQNAAYIFLVISTNIIPFRKVYFPWLSGWVNEWEWSWTSESVWVNGWVKEKLSECASEFMSE